MDYQSDVANQATEARGSERRRDIVDASRNEGGGRAQACGCLGDRPTPSAVKNRQGLFEAGAAVLAPMPPVAGAGALDEPAFEAAVEVETRRGCAGYFGALT